MSILLTKCTTSKYIEEGQYLLTENIIHESDKKVNTTEIYSLIKQHPNKKFLGIAPLYLAIYNLSNKSKENGYLKRIGQPPVILNYRLARKSATQIELYYKNKGYLDSEVSFSIVKRKHKAKVSYQINNGNKYKINSVNLGLIESEKLTKLIQNHLQNSKIKIGASYNYRHLEEERNSISLKIQNTGYFQFNKEYIYFLADTNRANKEAKVTNFFQVEEVLRQLSVKFDAKLIHQIMSEERGASLRLLYQMKLAIEKHFSHADLTVTNLK